MFLLSCSMFREYGGSSSTPELVNKSDPKIEQPIISTIKEEKDLQFIIKKDEPFKQQPVDYSVNLPPPKYYISTFISYMIFLGIVLFIIGLIFYNYIKNHKENIMNTDLDKMQNFLTQVKSFELPRWASRKLLLSIGLISALFILFYASLSTIVWPVTILAAVYMLTNVAETKISSDAKLAVKLKLIESMAKDGEITPQEAAVINQVS